MNTNTFQENLHETFNNEITYLINQGLLSNEYLTKDLTLNQCFKLIDIYSQVKRDVTNNYVVQSALRAAFDTEIKTTYPMLSDLDTLTVDECMELQDHYNDLIFFKNLRKANLESTEKMYDELMALDSYID